MNRLLTLLAFCILIKTNSGLAQDRNSVYNSVCAPFSFESSRHSCVDKIEQYEYLSGDAAKICGDMAFDSNKLLCLDVIGNKQYEHYELEDCAHPTGNFDSDILNCLKRRGQVYAPPISVSVPVYYPREYPRYYPVPYPRYYYPHSPYHFYPHYYPHRPLFGVTIKL